MASAQCHLGLPLPCPLRPNDGDALLPFCILDAWRTLPYAWAWESRTTPWGRPRPDALSLLHVYPPQSFWPQACHRRAAWGRARREAALLESN